MPNTPAVVRWRTCERKRMFETQAKANRIGKKFGQRAYLCPYCATWHLTKKRELPSSVAAPPPGAP